MFAKGYIHWQKHGQKASTREKISLTKMARDKIRKDDETAFFVPSLHFSLMNGSQKQASTSTPLTFSCLWQPSLMASPSLVFKVPVRKIIISVVKRSFLNGPIPASFMVYFCIFMQTSLQLYKKYMWKMSIQYMVLGFESTTFRTWVSSHNH